MRCSLALVAFFSLSLLATSTTVASPSACIDHDGDGFGNPGDPSCPGGPAPDCNNGKATVYPGAPELCDGLNNDCDHPYWPEVSYWYKQVISNTASSAKSVFVADVDGDGDLDTLSAEFAHDKVVWHENLHGTGLEWGQHVIAIVPQLETELRGPWAVYAADVDGDDDVDVLSASVYDGRIVWLENAQGDGSTWIWHLISSTALHARSLVAADVDGDDDMDVLSAAYVDSKIAWYENVPGDGSIWVEHVITTSAFNAMSVQVADIDGDDDLDVLSASYGDGVLAWYENTAGDGSAWTPYTIGTVSGAVSVFAADLDDDGDQDALLGAFLADEVVWFENSSGDGSSWVEHLISSSANGATSVFAADMDADDDLDVLATSGNGNRIAWYRDFFGDGETWLQETISTTVQGPTSVFAADLDDDNDMDVVSASAGDDTIAWYSWRSVEVDDDGDGLSECEGDCDDTNIQCSLDCTDVDGDGFCVTTDCDDTAPFCTVDCNADADGDGGSCLDDCDDHNPYCISDCTDLDGDGFCVTTDCADGEPQCNLDCAADADADGVTCLDDCDDLNECIRVDCEMVRPGCGPHCPDGVPIYALPDSDEDDIPDCEDNCPLTSNDQSDVDRNGVGDACDCGLTVTTRVDGDDGECAIDCTLREALSLATTGCGIRVPAGRYSLELGYLPLEPSGVSDPLQLSLLGVGSGYTILDGVGTDPTLGVSTVHGRVDLYVGGLAITNRGSGDGVTVVDATNTVVNLRLNHMTFTGMHDNRAVDVGSPQGGSRRVRFTFNRSVITDSETGIHVRGDVAHDGASCALEHSEVRGNTTGIWVRGGDTVSGGGGGVGLDGCSIHGNGTGILLEGGGYHASEGGRAIAYWSSIKGNTNGIVVGGGAQDEAGGAEVTLHQCEVLSNSEAGISLGSGCSDCPGGIATVYDGIIEGNGGPGLWIAGYPGGEASAEISFTTISGNRGGGVYNNGQLSAYNLTVSGNSNATAGGGIYNSSTAETDLNNATIVENESALGGGIYDDGEGESVQISNSVLANNMATEGPDCAGVLHSNGYNLVENMSDCAIVGETTNIVGLDPLLGPLQTNNGWNRTHLPLLVSPLVEAGSPAPYGSDDHACHYSDQREFWRPQYTWCDIGAVELRPSDCSEGDADGDAVCDPEDNCPGGPNYDQGPASLGQTIHAANAEEFSWEQAVDVVLLRGDLGRVHVYAVDWTETVPECDSFSDTDELDPGGGSYYLVRPDCGVGSWQTIPGQQPDRDSTLP